MLPFIYQTVSTVTESDGVNGNRTTAMDIRAVIQWPASGVPWFRYCYRHQSAFTISASYNRVTAHYFHQGGGQDYSTLGEYQDSGAFAKEGMEFRTETYGNDGKLYHVAVNQVNQTSLGNGRYFPYVQLSFECDSEPGATNRVTLTKLLYDLTTENLTNKIEYGEVRGFNPASVGTFSYTDANSGDNLLQYIHYATIGTNVYIVDHPDVVILKDNGGNVVQEADVTYNSSGGTPATKLTLITSGYYATNSYGNYDTYGCPN